MNRSRFSFALSLLSILMLFACAPRDALRGPEFKQYDGPVTAEILKKSIGFGDLKSIKALANIRIDRNGETAGSFNGVLGYKSPGKMKASFFGPFGVTVIELLIIEDLLQLDIPSRKILYEWSSPSISFSSLLNDKFICNLKDEGGNYALYIYSKDGKTAPLAKYLFDKTYLLNSEAIFYTDEIEIFKINFSSFNGSVPEKIGLSFPDGSNIEIALNEPEYNTEIPDQYFKEFEKTDKKVLPFREFIKNHESGRY